jgi:hypothetical protein
MRRNALVITPYVGWVQPSDAEYEVSVKLKPHVRWCGRGNEYNSLPRPDPHFLQITRGN